MDEKMVPDAEDFDVVEAMPRAKDASDAEKYRLAQAVKMMRLYGPPQGTGPNRYSKGD